MDHSSMSGDEVVITGIGGRFPNSENIQDFQQKLFNKHDFLTKNNPKWKTGDIKIPEKNAKIKSDKFDAQFFGIYKRMCENIHPVVRLTLECAYESIADAGLNPRLLRGKRTAVFTGSCLMESESTQDFNLNEFTLLGNAKSMLANRVSFFFGFQGPSIDINCLEASSASALEKGYNAIKNGEVESAIIVGCSLVKYPQLSLHLANLGVLSPDGLTRSFDESANGTARSEAVVVLFLQRARDAKRIYAQVKNIHSISGPSYDRLSTLLPTSDFQSQLMNSTLNECDISGNDISFVEADGSGIMVADVEEIKAIDQVFNKEQRQSPLLVGSVRSNIGSCFAANTLISIVKVIAMMENGEIPPNLHYSQASPKMRAIHENRIKIVTEKTPWNGEYVAVNTKSISGIFATVILKAFKKKSSPKVDDLPRLITVSGVTENSVATILDNLENKPLNLEMVQLINDLFEVEYMSHLYRGYTLLPPQGTSTTSKYRGIQYISNDKREIWYIFSGMGSQWIGMGKALMNLPIIAETLEKCDAILRPRGVDLMQILMSDDPEIFDNVLNCFIGITSIQIGLVDFLTHLGVKPDCMIGHSLGEIGCAYADGCLTKEQAILAAFYRGIVSLESNLIKGSMAAVGLGYEEIQPLCPPDIDVACHNSEESSTISGPEESIKSFIPILTAKGIFVKEVPCGHIAYHSRYIAPAGAKLLPNLQEIIPISKVRSSRWLSTSVPKNEWNSVKARLSSAEYHTNNLLNPVLFDQVLKLIPKEAITIEIAPHGLLQAILRRSLSSTITNLSLTRKNHQNNVEVLLDSIGKLYNNSKFMLDMSKLYSKINYPVSTGTPPISPLIKWNHSATWNKSISRYLNLKHDKAQQEFKINLKDEKWQFLKNYKLKSKVIIPCSLYLKLAITTMRKFDKSKTIIVFDNIIIHKNQHIDDDKSLTLIISIQTGSGNFQIDVDNVLICSGILRYSDHRESEINLPDIVNDSNEELLGNDVYDELLLRGYQFSKPFNTIYKSNPKGSFGYVFSQNDWSLFLEGMLQIYFFGSERKTVQVPLKIRKIIINLERYEEQSKQSKAIPISIIHKLNLIHSFGIELEGIQLTEIRQDPSENFTTIEKIKFTLNSDDAPILSKDFLKIILEILNENNVNGNNIQLIVKENELNNSEKFWNYWETIFHEYQFDTISPTLLMKNKYQTIALRIFLDVATLMDINYFHTIKEGDFLSAILENPDEEEILHVMENLNLGIVFRKRISNRHTGILFRRKRIFDNTCILENDQIKDEIKWRNFDRIILVTEKQNFRYDSLCNDEEFNKKVRYYEIDSKARKISFKDPLFQNQFELDLKFNILTADEKWGSRKSFSITDEYTKVKNSLAFQKVPNDLNSFDWMEQIFSRGDEKQIRVEYSTINEFDLLVANGEMKFLPSGGKNVVKFGLEYSGIDGEGERIMGISKSGTLSSFTTLDSQFSWSIPNKWTLEDAVTVPLAYATAYVALYEKAEIERNKSVLIYDGCCPIGQAAINLALNEGSRVFTTYRTEDERKSLKLQHPELNDDHLFRFDEQFLDGILFITKGLGVDVIIYNSSDMSRIEDCLTCSKLGCRFLIISENQQLFGKIGMFVFLKSLSIYSINPHNLINMDLDRKIKISSLMKDGLQKGVVKPILSNLYLRDELKQAFIDSSKKSAINRKTVIKVQPIDPNNCSSVIPQFSCPRDKLYLLITNNSNNLFAIKLINFLITHGARDIILATTMENNSKSLIYQYYSKIWEKSAETRIILHENINLSNNNNLTSLLNDALKINPIEAIFDLQRMENLRKNSFGKIRSINDDVTKILFLESKRICSNLRHFVVFTLLEDVRESLNCHLIRESNLMSICQERKEENLPILLIHWGAMIITDKEEKRGENLLATIPQFIEKLDYLMTLQSSIVAVLNNSSSKNRKKNINVEEKQKSEKDLFIEYIFK